MKNRVERNKRVAGFTLVELLVVLAILGMLAALVGPQVLNQLGGAKSKSAAIQISDLEQALEIYKLDVGRFPDSNQGLDALVREPAGVRGWNGPYLKKGELPLDPWVTLTNIKRRVVVAALSSLLWVPTEDLVVPVKMRTSPADTQSE